MVDVAVGEVNVLHVFAHVAAVLGELPAQHALILGKNFIRKSKVSTFSYYIQEEKTRPVHEKAKKPVKFEVKN